MIQNIQLIKYFKVFHIRFDRSDNPCFNQGELKNWEKLTKNRKFDQKKENKFKFSIFAENLMQIFSSNEKRWKD